MALRRALSFLKLEEVQKKEGVKKWSHYRQLFRSIVMMGQIRWLSNWRRMRGEWSICRKGGKYWSFADGNGPVVGVS